MYSCIYSTLYISVYIKICTHRYQGSLRDPASYEPADQCGWALYIYSYKYVLYYIYIRMYTDIRHPPASSNFERRDVLRNCGLVGSHTTHIYSYIRGRALYTYTTNTYMYIQYYVCTNRIHSTMYVRIYIRVRALYTHIRPLEFIRILK